MRWILVAALGLGGCAVQEVYGGRTPERETQGVQVAVVRWLAAHYEPNAFLGTPSALCLVVGEFASRRDVTATAMSARSEDWDPPPSLLAQLRSVEPEVVPISACRWGASLEEVVAATGERAITLGVAYPDWVTPNLVRVRATLRENQDTWYRYMCSVERLPEGWAVRECL